MSRNIRVVAVVCIAVFAFAAIAAVQTFALVDAQTPVDDLFIAVCSWVVPAAPDVPLRAAPAVDVHSPRPPPASLHS